MKIHVQCDRCKKYEEATGPEYHRYAVKPPDTWTHLRAFREPIHLDGQYGLPDGVLAALFCGDCMPVVQRAVEAAIARKT
jgi:hypothetical protein